MENVLLKFGLCLMVVLDDGNELRSIFEKMSNALGINFHIWLLPSAIIKR